VRSLETVALRIRSQYLIPVCWVKPKKPIQVCCSLQDGWLTVTSKQKGGAKPGPREVEPQPLPSASAWSKPLKSAALRSDGPPESGPAASSHAEGLNGASSWAANGHPSVPPPSAGLVASSSLGRPGTPTGSVPRAAPKRTVSAASSSSVVSVAASANGDAIAGPGSGSHTGTRMQMQSPQKPQLQAGFEAWPSTAPPAAVPLGQLPQAISPAAGPSVSWRTVGSQLTSANGSSRVQVCIYRISGMLREMLLDSATTVEDYTTAKMVLDRVLAWSVEHGVTGLFGQTGAEPGGICVLPSTMTVMSWLPCADACIGRRSRPRRGVRTSVGCGLCGRPGSNAIHQRHQRVTRGSAPGARAHCYGRTSCRGHTGAATAQAGHSGVFTGVSALFLPDSCASQALHLAMPCRRSAASSSFGGPVASPVMQHDDVARCCRRKMSSCGSGRPCCWGSCSRCGRSWRR